MIRILLILCSVLCLSCNNTTKLEVFSTENLELIYTPSYANRFSLYSYSKSTILKINKPWQGDHNTELLYFFSREGEQAPNGFNGITINLPLKRVVSMSTSYTAFIERLGADSLIKGVSGAQFIYSPSIVKRVENNEIRDVGYESGLNYELLVSIAPDVIFIYGINGENSVVTDKVKELGVNVVYLGDYLENHPLGRAEWLVVMGELLGKRDMAVQIFEHISQQYNEVKAIAKYDTSGSMPKVMLNAPWRDTWFVPGDRSYMVQLINDASGEYVCKGDDSDQSRPISSESAYVAALQADLWLSPGNVNNISELISMNPNFANVPSIINSEVYNNNARSGVSGGSDFWESGVVFPHIVLMDMIKIFHPHLLPKHKLFYFHKLN